MRVRTVVLLACGALAIAASAFLVGSYVFPHADVGSPDVVGSVETSATTDSTKDAGALAAFGIEMAAEGVVPPSAVATGTSGPAEFSAADAAAALAALESPTQGMVIGEVLSSGEPSGTVKVRIDLFNVIVPTDDGGSTRFSLPSGTTVTLIEPPAQGEPKHAAKEPEIGRTIRADIRIEPATDGTRGRIIAVNIEVMGSTP